MTKWRIIKNEWNLQVAPWRGAVGIEEDDPTLAVPAIVCWFTRGWPISMVQQVVDAHNSTNRSSLWNTLFHAVD